ncbi:DUF2007 domain-containing protein [Flaviaesturariibacter amylovorans]|uniref:DUF2007 domain-containing protein n=1 Tax=Flaviaesturariibacter amylovorans TaxID=1084520 RepID=A0ABP8HTS1_9BACT
MNFVAVSAYLNYIDAHIAQAQLEDAHIRCWLKDEHTVTTNPMFTNAVGGIKLMVAEPQLGRAQELLQAIEAERRRHARCPLCAGGNIEWVHTPRKTANNVVSAALSYLFGNMALAPDKVQHCFDCGHEWDEI